MKTYNLVLVMLLIAAVTVLVTLNAYQLARTPDNLVAVQDQEYLFFVQDHVGFDLETDILRLGGVNTGSVNNRYMTVEHPTADRVAIEVLGKGKGLLTADPSDAELVDGKAEIEFSATSYPNVAQGEYRGIVRFYFYNVNN